MVNPIPIEETRIISSLIFIISLKENNFSLSTIIEKSEKSTSSDNTDTVSVNLIGLCITLSMLINALVFCCVATNLCTLPIPKLVRLRDSGNIFKASSAVFASFILIASTLIT